MFKVRKICSKLQNMFTRLSGGLIINFENILRLVLVFLLLTYEHCQIQNGNVIMNGSFFNSPFPYYCYSLESKIKIKALYDR